MDGLQVKSVPQNEWKAMHVAGVGKAVPVEGGLAANDDVLGGKIEAGG